MNRYSVLHHFADPNFNIGNTNSDYINIMNELKDSILLFNNNIYNTDNNLIKLFAFILNTIISTAQQKVGFETEISKKLGVFSMYYYDLIGVKNNINNAQLETMCNEFKHILGNKHDVGFEVKYNKQLQSNEKLFKMHQPIWKKIQEQYKKVKEKAIKEYNRQYNNNI